jgi:DNA-binding response OmpR family regulator
MTASILVVEDEPAILRLVTRILEKKGYLVLSAATPTDALRMAVEHTERIDLLLTDVVMQGLNGREVAERFRAARPEARVLFMSGYASDVVAQDGVLDGDADLLVKPFSPHELEARVRAALRR